MLVALVLTYRETYEQILAAVNSAGGQVDRIIVGHVGPSRNLAFLTLRGDVELVEYDNRSILHNRRALVEAAPEGAWCIFLDGDDVFMPTLRAALAWGQALDPEAEALFCDTLQVDAAGLPTHPTAPTWSRRSPEWSGWPDWLPAGGLLTFGCAIGNCIAGAGAIFFQRKAWIRLPEMGEWFGGEDFLYTAALVTTARCVLVPLVTVRYLAPSAAKQGVVGSSSDWSGPDPVRAAIEMHRQHWGEPDYLYDNDWVALLTVDAFLADLDRRLARCV